jgi:hypothetical protein
MAEQLLFDKVTYIDRLKRAGIGDDQARAHAEAIEQALRESVATTNDLSRLGTSLDSKIDVASARLDSKIDVAIRDLTIRMGGMIMAAFAALAAIRFFGA